MVNRHKFFEIPEEYRKTVKLDSIMIKDPFFAYITDSLHNALVRLSSNELQEMPVVSNEDNRVLGVVTISDLVKLYDKEVQKILKLKKNNSEKNNSDILSSLNELESSHLDSNPNLDQDRTNTTKKETG